MPDPPGCPTGTTDNGSGKCQYSDGSLVPTLLGTEGTGNFGALLARLTPGLRANDSYVIAAGDHTNNAEVTDPSGKVKDQPNRPGNSEMFTAGKPAAGTWTLTVKGVKAYSGVTVLGAYTQ